MMFYIFDGKIITKGFNFSFLLLEESFHIIQKVWFGFGGIPLFNENIELLAQLTGSLKLPFPKEFENRRELLRLTKRMLNKNKYYRSGFVYFHLFINSKSETHTLVTSHPLYETEFPFSKEGIILNFSNQKKPAQNRYNRYAFFNKTLWDIALSELHNTYFQNTVILNEKNMVCECAYANIFMIQNNNIITPSLSSGCYEDIIRTYILDAAACEGKKIVEHNSLYEGYLMNMDEIFIAGEQIGVQWILGLENKRFVHHFSTKVYNKLNEILKEKIN